MKTMITAAFAAVLLAVPAFAQEKANEAAKSRSLEVSFDYKRQQTHGSNQFAVWIENDKGELVKTLVVTAYTTKGRVRGNEKPMRGYVKRPYCVPSWVKVAKPEELTDKQLEAYSKATPSESGVQSFTWDFTDQKGAKVQPGAYRVNVEATIQDASRVIFTGTLAADAKPGSKVEFTSKFSEPILENYKDIVTNVKAVLK